MAWQGFGIAEHFATEISRNASGHPHMSGKIHKSGAK
jgi:hypothetical protein